MKLLVILIWRSKTTTTATMMTHFTLFYLALDSGIQANKYSTRTYSNRVLWFVVVVVVKLFSSFLFYNFAFNFIIAVKVKPNISQTLHKWGQTLELKRGASFQNVKLGSIFQYFGNLNFITYIHFIL